MLTGACMFLGQPKVDPANPKVDFAYEEQNQQQLDERQELQVESADQCGDHDNPDCFSWTLMNVCITKHITAAVKAVVAAAGVEILGEFLVYCIFSALLDTRMIKWHALSIFNVYSFGIKYLNFVLVLCPVIILNYKSFLYT